MTQQTQTLTLGQLISKLEAQNPANSLVFDFCGVVPTQFQSWRGVYSELALGFEAESDRQVTVADLLRLARNADGETYMGYKGGHYVSLPPTKVRGL